MGFVQAGFLGALAALAIPVLIHLLFRTRYRPVDLGTLQFLRVVLHDNARRRRVRRWLLLTLRLACVALLAFLFARPYLVASEPDEGGRLVVALIDGSASMGLKDRTRPIDRAVAEVRKIAARAGPRTQLELAWFDATVQPIAPTAGIPSGRVDPVPAATDYDAAMAWARDVLARSPRGAKELHVLTDLQRSGLGRGGRVALPSDVTVHLRDLGRAFPKNVAVMKVAASAPTIRPGEKATVTATVFNASPLPLEKIPVRLHLEAGASAYDLEGTVDLEGGQAKAVAFALDELGEGLWKGHVAAASADELPFDDRRYLALSVAPPLRVLLADGAPGRSPVEAETYFLQAALRLAPTGERFAKSPFDPRTVRFDDGAALPDLAGTDLVVLANVAAVSLADATKLAEFVARGGGLLVFTGDRVQTEGDRSFAAAGLGVGEIEGSVIASEAPWRIERWEAGHPLFRPFEDPEHGDLRRPAFATITRIKPDPGARVLAWFRGGAPALLERAHGRGRVLLFASACDRDWGDWPRSRLYLPLVHQMLAHAAGLSEGGRVRPELAGPGRPPGFLEAGGICRVVNVDPSESRTERCTPREFADRYGFRPPQVERDPTGPVLRPKDDRLRSDEIWPWLALALIGVLLAENFLANRTAS